MRRSLPPELIWLALVILAIWLSPAGSTRFGPEGLFYSWILPSLGIVWTMSLLYTRPVTGRRFARFFAEAAIGTVTLVVVLAEHVKEFNAPEVGGCQGLLHVGALFLVLAITTFVVYLTRNSKRFTRPIVATIGSVAMMIVGLTILHAGLNPPQGITLHGGERAEWLAEWAGSMDSDRRDIPAGILYKDFRHYRAHYLFLYILRGHAFAIDVPIDLPEGADAVKLAEFWNSDVVRELFEFPRQNWQAHAMDAGRDPYPKPALVFRFEEDVERWDLQDVTDRRQIAEFRISRLPWVDLVPLTQKLIAEMPPPEKWSDADKSRVQQMRLDITLDRIARECPQVPRDKILGLVKPGAPRESYPCEAIWLDDDYLAELAKRLSPSRSPGLRPPSPR